MPGVTVGDMGEKVALNGVDNGFLLFNNYSVPRFSLLNKNADVTENGQYVARIKDQSKLFGEIEEKLKIFSFSKQIFVFNI